VQCIHWILEQIGTQLYKPREPQSAYTPIDFYIDILIGSKNAHTLTYPTQRVPPPPLYKARNGWFSCGLYLKFGFKILIVSAYSYNNSFLALLFNLTANTQQPRDAYVE
jgi:hypothetical protein